MIIFLVLLCIGISVVLYLFFAPFYLEVNSDLNVYRVRFHKLFCVRYKPEESSIETNFLGWSYERPLITSNKNERPVIEKQKKTNGKPLPVAKLLRVMKTFKINKCYVCVDSGDMHLNGLLYPFFAWLNWYSGKIFQINFTGRNLVILEVENSLARMSRAWLGSHK